MNKPKVAVVIVHWNRQSLLSQFLPSVTQSTYENLNIYIADNASTDESVAYVKEHFPTVRIVELADNYGYAGGYNRALKFIEADYYVLLNNDIEVPSGWIEPVIDYLEKNEIVAAAQPKMLDYLHRNKFEYAGASGGMMDFLGYAFCRGRLFDELEEDKGQYDSIQQVFWATGACLFIRSSAFHKVGGFDEYFFAHMEEIDLCWRLQLLGHKLAVIPQSHVYHLGGGTLSKMNAHKTFLNFRNNLIMLTKNLPISTLLWLIPVRSFLDLLSSIHFLFKGQFEYSAAIHKAHAGYFFNLKKWIGLRSKTTKPMNELTGLYHQSIVWQYFVKKKRSFDSLD
jgi:GT2 family glycosyltransferase